MPELELVHPVPADDAAPWVRQVMGTLLGNPYGPDYEQALRRRLGRWVPERIWGVRDRGRFVGTLGTEARELTVPGPAGVNPVLPFDALTTVTVAATHRRRGLLTQMIGQSLRAAKERGDSFSGLLAAEWPIYGRYGYAPSARYADYTYRTRVRGATVAPSGRGLVREVEPADLLPHAGAIFDRARRQRAGQIDRPEWWWRNVLDVDAETPGGGKHWIVREGADGPDGLMAWKVTRDFEIDGSYGAVTVDSLVATSDDAYRDLWAYLGSIDLVDEVLVHNRPVDEPARHLMVDGRALLQRYTGDFLWLCLLDTAAALSARGYACDGRLVLDVVDPTTGGYAAGRYRLDGGPDGATCTPSTESADLTLPARTLASAYLGGQSVQALGPAAGVEEHTAGARQRLDAMLATSLAPWCQTGF